MEIANDFGLGQRKEIIISLQVRRPFAETLATIIRLLKLITLNHGAHRAVENKDALGERLLQQ